jgi:flavodoxin
MCQKEIKKLVIYYSLDGNTKFIAENIALAVNADLLELKLKKEISRIPLIKQFSGGMQCVLKKKPGIHPLDKNPENYDTIFIGTPVWAGTYASPFNTLFSNITLKNKNIALFCCYGGSKGKTFEDFKTQLAGNNIIGEAEFKSPAKYDKDKNAANSGKWATEMLKK